MKNIKARFTGERRFVSGPPPLMQVGVEVTREQHVARVAEIYHAEVRLGAQYAVPCWDAKERSIETEAPEHILRGLAYEIYGEIEHEIKMLLPFLYEMKLYQPELVQQIEARINNIMALCRP